MQHITKQNRWLLLCLILFLSSSYLLFCHIMGHAFIDSLLSFLLLLVSHQYSCLCSSCNEVYYSLFLITSFTLDGSAFCSCRFCCLPASSDLNKLLNAIKARQATHIQDSGGNGAIQKVYQGLCLVRRSLVKQISRVTQAEIKDEDDIHGRKNDWTGEIKWRRLPHGTK